jgi:hypothetical protein
MVNSWFRAGGSRFDYRQRNTFLLDKVQIDCRPQPVSHSVRNNFYCCLRMRGYILSLPHTSLRRTWLKLGATLPLPYRLFDFQWEYRRLAEKVALNQQTIRLNILFLETVTPPVVLCAYATCTPQGKNTG